MKLKILVILLVFTQFLLLESYSSDKNDNQFKYIPLTAKAEIILQKNYAKIDIFITNKSKKHILLYTGDGRGIVAVPTLVFENNTIRTSFSAPIVTSPPRRSLSPNYFYLKPKEVKLYYWFYVHPSYVEGKFLNGKIHIPKAGKTWPQLINHATIMTQKKLEESLEEILHEFDIPIIDAIVTRK
jgi:hypothetical protein